MLSDSNVNKNIKHMKLSSTDNCQLEVFPKHWRLATLLDGLSFETDFRAIRLLIRADLVSRIVRRFDKTFPRTLDSL